jgi:hypothetical protein
LTDKALLELVAESLTRAEQHVGAAREGLGHLRTIRIGRLAVSWQPAPARIDPVRLQSPGVSVYDVVNITHEMSVLESGLRVDQIITINGAFRIVADSRYFSLDFYRSAIAKFLERDSSQRR